MKAKWTAEQAELEQGGDTLLDIEGAAHMLGTTVRHLRRLRSENRIPYVKLGGKLRFPLVYVVDLCVSWWARRDLNPRPPPCKSDRRNSLTSEFPV